jgi:predicted nucleic acid-binding protein
VKGYLLDTNCISEAVSAKPNARVLEWLDAADEGILFLSVLTLGEIRKGIAGLSSSRRRTQLEVWLERELPARFAGRILAIDAAVADRWGTLAADAKRRGKPLGSIDALLAATALQFELTLVTRNTADFAATRVSLLNLWSAM